MNVAIMNKYICPMHSEVISDEPGRCPKCGMSLVENEKISYQEQVKSPSEKTKDSYTPLIVILSVILISSLAVGLKSWINGVFTPKVIIETFMIGFFLTFSTFKIMDLKGFAEGYSTYDLLAKRWFHYGYIYPFIELFFGLAMILTTDSKPLLIGEILVMGFSGIGVAIKIAKKEHFRCACLGTFLKVPLTKVTLVEDFGMALLAFVLLLF